MLLAHAVLATVALCVACGALPNNTTIPAQQTSCGVNYLSQNISMSVNPSRAQVKFLITGCPHNGELFTMKLFECNGYHLGFRSFRVSERYDGILSWELASSSAEEFDPILSQFSFDVVLHQVRHPLETINEILHHDRSMWVTVCDLVPEINQCRAHQQNVGEFSALERAANFWFYWNLLAERRSTLTYTVESLLQGQKTAEIESALNLPPGHFRVGKAFSAPNQLNSSSLRAHKLSWWDVFLCVSRDTFEKIVCLSERYGYDVSHARVLLNSTLSVEDARYGVWALTTNNSDPTLIEARTRRVAPHLWVRLCCQGLSNNRDLCTD